ncbi:MAG TPA: GMC family oxidoreductase [Roseimicrobium sp.]|nr:GMC family oxidoreductase [Roseimicrobium sp.]
MPIVTSSKTQPSYDVIIIGSGAAGGQTAYTLAMAGVKVLMLEAGRNYDPVKETAMFNEPWKAPLRAERTNDKYFGFYDATIDGGWQVPGEPYTNASKDPDREFWWWRARMLGGRTNHWGRIALRNGPYDFKPYSRDGLGFDWPISYEDVEPYYTKVEMLIGVYGTNEGLENTPNSPAGVLLPPPAARASELLTKKHCDKLKIPVIPAHRAVLSRVQDWQTIPAKLHPDNPRAQKILAEEMKKRQACFWATHCVRGCSIKANYQSTTVHLPPALATGNLDIIPNAHAREISIDANGKATGVYYVDKATGKDMQVKGRIVVLAASSGESVRILLNSKSARFPNGLANSSGKVGKYLMDSVGASLGGQIPALENMPPHNEDGAGGLHMYMPWWLYKEQLAGKLNFPRGYHVEFGGSRQMPSVGTFSGLEGLTQGAYGVKLKEAARRYYGSFVGYAGRGDMVPNDDCYCEIDPVVKDKFGIPVLRFHWKWSDYELNQAKHMQQTFAEIITAMGGKPGKPQTDGLKAIDQGGKIIHEVGGTIMGSDPKKTVLNQYNQSWDVKNLFITDGSGFCSNADKNPTLTIMALAWRASDYMLDEMKKGNL